MMSPEQYFAVGMNFLDMRKCLKKIFIQVFLPQRTYLYRKQPLDMNTDIKHKRCLFHNASKKKQTMSKGQTHTSSFESW